SALLEVDQSAEIYEQPVTVEFQNRIEGKQSHQVDRIDGCAAIVATGQEVEREQRDGRQQLEIDAANVDHGALPAGQPPGAREVDIESGEDEVNADADRAVLATIVAAGGGVAEFVHQRGSERQ